MICLYNDHAIIDGGRETVAAELATIISTIREKDPEIIPIILSCVYKNSGKSTLEDALKEFRADTTMILKNLQRIEENKNGRQ